MTFYTSSIVRGGRSLPEGQPPGARQRLALRQDGSLAVDLGGGVSERVRNGARGAEQSWRFSSKPGGGETCGYWSESPEPSTPGRLVLDLTTRHPSACES